MIILRYYGSDFPVKLKEIGLKIFDIYSADPDDIITSYGLLRADEFFIFINKNFIILIPIVFTIIIDNRKIAFIGKQQLKKNITNHFNQMKRLCIQKELNF